MDRRIAALRRVLFLKDLPDDALRVVAAAGVERRCERGDILLREGEVGPGLLVVLAGAVKLCKWDARGRELILGVERAGASVGELPLFDGGNCPYSAEVAEDGTLLFSVSGERFRALMAAHPAIAAGAVRALAVQNRRLLEMLKAQALHTVRSRLAAYLLAHARQHGNAFPLPESNAAIGSHVGTVREVVSRTLHALCDAGAIRLRGRHVTVCDPALLARIAARDEGA